MKSAFAQNDHQNDHKKALLQESEGGTFDINEDEDEDEDEFDDDEFDDEK